MEKDSMKRKANPARIQFLRSLPREIKEYLTLEEANAILYEDIWPDSLVEKLKDYFVEE